MAFFTAEENYFTSASFKPAWKTRLTNQTSQAFAVQLHEHGSWGGHYHNSWKVRAGANVQLFNIQSDSGSYSRCQFLESGGCSALFSSLSRQPSIRLQAGLRRPFNFGMRCLFSSGYFSCSLQRVGLKSIKCNKWQAFVRSLLEKLVDNLLSELFLHGSLENVPQWNRWINGNSWNWTYDPIRVHLIQNICLSFSLIKISVY